jgi:hypothetical protein
MKPSQLRVWVFSIVAVLSTAWAVSIAQAQPDAQPDPEPNVLDLESPSETGCISGSYVAAGACARDRAMKADRWLKAIVAGCLKKAEAWTRDRYDMFEHVPALKTEVRGMASEVDYAILLRRTQDAFERYRESAATETYDGSLPGMLATHERYRTYFDLTLERANRLHRDCCRDEPVSKAIDLTKPWCE